MIPASQQVLRRTMARRTYENAAPRTTENRINSFYIVLVDSGKETAAYPIENINSTDPPNELI